MASDTLQQFSSMVSEAFQLSDSRPSSRLSIRETVTYPKVTVTDSNNYCLDPIQPFEHVHSCGHLITTALPDQSCAPNCHHVAQGGGDLDLPRRNRTAISMDNGTKVSEKSFYCDASVESENETKMPKRMLASKAEESRATYRAYEAKKRSKDTKFRKCYIAAKVTSVPCHEDGALSSRYVPTEGEERHPFDTSLPRAGANMFEDVDADLVEDIEKNNKKIES